MPAVLTHKAIMLLARERLAEFRDVLDLAIERRQASGQAVTNLETDLRRLADLAHKMMSSQPHADSRLPGDVFARPLEDQVSKFAVMGCMGPDIPGFSEVFRPGQAWIFDTIHKGGPDSDKEPVISQATDFALELWAQTAEKIRTDIADPAARDVALNKVRAYAMGHLCHLAGDIISHPLINDLEWHSGTEIREKLEHADGEGSHDAAVARTVFLRSDTRAGESWDRWWPTMDEVPPQLFDGFAAAFMELYGDRNTRPRGFGKFEEELGELDPPDVEAGFFRDGYSMYRSGVLGVVYDHGFWKWLLMLAPVALPLLAMPFLSVYGLPKGKLLLHNPDNKEKEDGNPGLLQQLAMPIWLSAPATLIYLIRLKTITSRGVGTISGLTFAFGIILTIVAIIFLVMLVKGHGGSARNWILFFALPLAIALAFAISAFVDLGRDGHERHSAYAIVGGLPAFFTAFWLLLGFLILSLPALAGDATRTEPTDFLPYTIYWLLQTLIIWLALSFHLRDIRIPNNPKDFVTSRRHAVRLFDEASLFSDPVQAALDQPTRHYPSGRRALFKLWWDGAGEMSVRSDRFGLTFKLEHEGATAEQTVPAPLAPMTGSEFLQFLNNHVGGPADETGHLHGAFVYDEPDEDYELPPGATFAAHGDHLDDPEERAEKAAEFKKLGSSETDTDYVLSHANKPVYAIRLGPNGPIADPFGITEFATTLAEKTNGYLYVHDVMEGRQTETIMSYAADFGALLCLGAVPHLAQPADGLDPADAGAVPDKVFQVFRNWSLDRRRINEWRMLVDGKAFSEKGGAPQGYDPAMPQGRHGPADPAAWTAPLHDPADDAVIREGERTACELGWVPTLRKWLELAAAPNQNLTGRDVLRDGFPENQALSRAMAFILDRADPA